MLIRRVILENYGLFSGVHEFDLVPRTKYRRRRPVILFGGKNGAGKTTLLEAVRLTLYGRGVLGTRVSKRDYKAFLRSRIHRSKNAALPASYAAVSLQFDYVVRGEKSEFHVERSWDCRNGKAVREQLAVQKDGKPLTDVDPEYWEEFVRGIVPERLSKLFFFDGEQITSIAEDETGTEALAESIKSLLGLDLVERLKADLSIYSSRTARTLSKGKEKQRLTELSESIENLEGEVRNCVGEVTGTATAIQGVEAEIRNTEKYLQNEGNAYADNRISLKQEESTLTERIEHLEKGLRQECEGLFPMSLCPQVATALQSQLDAEKELQRWEGLRDGLTDLQNELIDSMVTSLRLGGKKAGAKSLADIQRIVEEVISERLTKPDSIQGVQAIHQLSGAEVSAIQSALDSGQRVSGPRVKSLARDLEKAQRALQKVRINLSRVPDDAAVKPHVEKLVECNRRLGEHTQKHTQLETLQKSLENDLATHKRERVRIEDKLREKEGLESTLGRTEILQSALTDYLDKLTAEKIAALRGSVTECYNRLSRKNDVLLDIGIDPRSFEVTLFDHKHRPIPKAELSAGEKQMFAISLLWGLAKTSGRQLPVIIDTPLARLDSDHRRNLIEGYFPHASHQVIVLSTDTEVDQELFAQLSPDISHCYHLGFDESEQSAKPEEGYFWKERANA